MTNSERERFIQSIASMNGKIFLWLSDGRAADAGCREQMTISNKEAAGLAEAAGCPPGWYEGPWFDEDGALQTGPPPCLFKLILLARGPRGFQA